MCRTKDEVRKVLAIADAYGFCWFDTSNGNVLCGYNEATQMFNPKEGLVLTFGEDTVIWEDWGNHGKYDIEAKDFISHIFNKDVELTPSELQELNLCIPQILSYNLTPMLHVTLNHLMEQLNKPSIF